MKLRKILFLAVLIANLSYSQEIKIEGKMDDNYKTLYYSINKLEFTPKDTLNIIGQNYSLVLNNKKVKTLYISNSLWNEDTPDTKENCVHSIDIKSIMKNFSKKSHSEIIITNDIITNPKCGISFEKELPKEFNKFLGDYIFTVNGKKNKTKINSQKRETVLSEMNDKYMTNENSNWSYSDEKKQLTFSRVMQYNPNYGLKLIIFENYIFSVKDENGKLSFISVNQNCELEKI